MKVIKQKQLQLRSPPQLKNLKVVLLRCMAKLHLRTVCRQCWSERNIAWGAKKPEESSFIHTAVSIEFIIFIETLRFILV